MKLTNIEYRRISFANVYVNHQSTSLRRGIFKRSRKILDLAGATATYRLSCSTGRCDPCRGTARHLVSSRPLCTRPTKCPRSPCIPSRGSPAGPHTHKPVRDHHVQMRTPVTKCTERESEVSPLFSELTSVSKRELAAVTPSVFYVTSSG